MPQGKLSEIIGVIYDTIEALAPFYDADALFVRWKTIEPLINGDVAVSLRNFRVAVPNVSHGSLQDSTTKRSKKAMIQVQILYPAAYFPVGDTSYLGVEMMREDDGALIVNALCFKRPLALQTIGDVRSIKWLGSSQQGRLWVISLDVEYLETMS